MWVGEWWVVSEGFVEEWNGVVARVAVIPMLRCAGNVHW